MKKKLLIGALILASALVVSSFGISLFLLDVHRKDLTANFYFVYCATFDREMRETFSLAEPYLEPDQRIDLLRAQDLMNIRVAVLSKKKDREAIETHPGASQYIRSIEEALEKSSRYTAWKGSDAQRKIEHLRAFENDTRMIGQNFLRASIFSKARHIKCLEYLNERLPTTKKECAKQKTPNDT
jgi:hypothetical protein